MTYHQCIHWPTMKRIAILQSNYIPWKGYFDLIAAVDEFVLYDSVQFTRRDWRSRNRIKTPQGLQWLTVPTGQSIQRAIRDVELEPSWQAGHWKTLQTNYRRAKKFDEIQHWLEPLYFQHAYSRLSELNRVFIETICQYLGIKTKITNAWDYVQIAGKTSNLVNICTQAAAGEYVTGPAAQNYIDHELFQQQGIQLTWFDYSGYKEYPQLWGDFCHEVTILDLLFNCGTDAARYMKHVE